MGGSLGGDGVYFLVGCGFCFFRFWNRVWFIFCRCFCFLLF